MDDDSRQTPAARPEPPPFDPDTDLIEHLEGNKRERRRYRQAADDLREKMRIQREQGQAAAGED